MIEPMIWQWNGKVVLEVLERDRKEGERKMEEEEVEGRYSRNTWPGGAASGKRSHSWGIG